MERSVQGIEAILVWPLEQSPSPSGDSISRVSLRILITNHDLSQVGGSQLYTVDLATALLERGHQPVVFTTRPGLVSDQLRRATIPVVSRLEQLGEAPDVIHGHHLLETAAAVLAFPGVPAVFVCHGWFPWQEEPPRLPRVRRYLAVDRLRRERLVSEHGIPPEQVEILPNFVDLRRFDSGPERPATPRRALILSNGTRNGGWVGSVRAACAAAGLPLDVVGIGEGNAVTDTATLLTRYDLVFARGRAAMEAAASGAFVVLCDCEGLGPPLLATNAPDLRQWNFGVASLRTPHSEPAVRERIAAYSPTAAVAARDWMITHASHGPAIDRLLSIYAEVIAEERAAPADPEAERSALARLFERVTGLLAGYDALTLREEDARRRLAVFEQSPWRRIRRWLSSRLGRR